MFNIFPVQKACLYSFNDMSQNENLKNLLKYN